MIEFLNIARKFFIGLSFARLPNDLMKMGGLLLKLICEILYVLLFIYD